jgi:hypothetical protein
VLFHFAKFLQMVGIADVGFSIWSGFTHPEGMNKEIFFFVGVGLFWGGRLLERHSAS